MMSVLSRLSSTTRLDGRCTSVIGASVTAGYAGGRGKIQATHRGPGMRRGAGRGEAPRPAPRVVREGGRTARGRSARAARASRPRRARRTGDAVAAGGKGKRETDGIVVAERRAEAQRQCTAELEAAAQVEV